MARIAQVYRGSREAAIQLHHDGIRASTSPRCIAAGLHDNALVEREGDLKPFPARALRAWNDGRFAPHISAFGGSTPAGNTNTIQSTTPWAGQAPYYTGNSISSWAPTGNGGLAQTTGGPGVYGAAQALYEDAAPSYYPGDTYSGLTGEQSLLGQNLIQETDTGGSPALQAANSNIASTLSPEFTAQTQGTFNGANDYLNSAEGGNFSSTPGFGAFNSGSNALGNIASGNYYSGSTSPTFGQSQGVLSNELSSSYLNPQNSPAYEGAMSNALASALPAANASFVNGNRSDSGLAQAASTSAATNAALGLAQQQYNTNQGVQQNAANLSSNNYFTGENAATTAANGATSAFGTAGGLQSGAAAQSSNNLLNQQATQSRDTLTAPSVDQGTMSNLATALNTSGMYQTDAQNQLNANVAAYNYGQMLPWNDLSMYESAVTGTGNQGGSTNTSQPYFSNPLANIMSGVSAVGAGLTGASALAQAAGYSGLISGGSALL